jgi:hypothetical protein
MFFFTATSEWQWDPFSRLVNERWEFILWSAELFTHLHWMPRLITQGSTPLSSLVWCLGTQLTSAIIYLQIHSRYGDESNDKEILNTAYYAVLTAFEKMSKPTY